MDQGGTAGRSSGQVPQQIPRTILLLPSSGHPNLYTLDLIALVLMQSFCLKRMLRLLGP